MSQPLIVLGDKTSHGGTVISCAPTTDTMGKGWARVGDMVACPRCKGVFPISQGNNSLIEDGQAVAYHGCKVACGASLIASQMHTTTEPSGDAAAGAVGSTSDEVLTKGFGAIGSNLIAGYQDEPLDATGERFRGRFQVLDLSSGEPVQANRYGCAQLVASTSPAPLMPKASPNGLNATPARHWPST
jgi:uncharacterized Zn-binding protein involved in type VI secretion